MKRILTTLLVAFLVIAPFPAHAQTIASAPITVRLASTGAESNTAIVTVAARTKIVVTRITVTSANSNGADVSVIIGFGASTTPTTTGVVLAHPGIAPGSGVVEGNGGATLGMGADGEDLRITSSDPSGTINTVVTYYLITY